MKIEIKNFAKILAGLIFPLIFIVGCQKELPNDPIEETSEPYILSQLDSIPCDSPYFVMIKFEDSELYYSLSDSTIVMGPTYSSGAGNMIGKGYAFLNNSSSESAEIIFYAHKENPTFEFQTANYQFGNPWNSIPGANIGFFSPTGNPHTFYRYLGTNGFDSYFWITWIDEDRMCGQFKTKLVECCGSDVTFWVEGEFSVPVVIF